MWDEIDMEKSGKVCNIFLLTVIRAAVCFLLAAKSHFVFTASGKKKMIFTINLLPSGMGKHIFLFGIYGGFFHRVLHVLLHR